MHRLPFALLALAALTAFAAMVPVAVGQEHEHEVSTGVVIAHDLPPSGRTYVGNLNHFVVLYLGDDAVPDFHQQNQVRVLLNEVVVFETTDDSGHDYDGVYGFDVSFLAPGRFRVEALQEGTIKAKFEGNVDQPNSDVVGTPDAQAVVARTLLGPVAVGPGTLSLTYAAMADGNPIPHSDAIYEVYTRPGDLVLTPTGDRLAPRSPDLVLRIKTHTHEGLQSVSAVLADDASYDARIQTYRSYPASGLDFQPGVQVVGYTAPISTPTAPLGTLTTTPALPDNVVVSAALGDLTLVGTFDPYNVVGPDTLMHLTVAVLDANRTPVQHVNFVAELIGPDGSVLLSSETLHEYDGILEVDTVQAIPGPYVLRVTADRGTTGTIELPYTVSPAAPDLAQGPQIVTVTGIGQIEVGQVADINIHIEDLLGNPYQHNEVDVVIDRQVDGVDEIGIPVLRAKLHTHADGDFPFKVTFQEPGLYRVRMSPYPLGLQAAPQFYLDEVGKGLTFDFDVKEGTFPTGSDAPPAAEAASEEAPMPAVLVLLAVAIALVACRRR